MFYERDKQVITLIQCLCSINAVKYWAQVTFRAGLHKLEISKFTHFKMAHATLLTSRSYFDGMHYMLAHHIVVQRKLIEHCAQRFVSNTHFSKLLLFCTY